VLVGEGEVRKVVVVGFRCRDSVRGVWMDLVVLGGRWSRS
jgi:hypothetical protein